jgi:hypothetical protein
MFQLQQRHLDALLVLVVVVLLLRLVVAAGAGVVVVAVVRLLLLLWLVELAGNLRSSITPKVWRWRTLRSMPLKKQQLQNLAATPFARTDSTGRLLTGFLFLRTLLLSAPAAGAVVAGPR